MIPLCSQTGVPFHFQVSTTPGSASWMSPRTRESVSPRQSSSSSIRASISSDGFTRYTLAAFEHPAPAGLDPARLPQDCGEGPGRDEQADDRVPDAAEVEAGEERPEPAGQRELLGGHLQQLDRADHERDR